MRHVLTNRILLTAFILAMFFQAVPCFAMGSKPEPAATVIDDETGKPIEGAVAIAIWRVERIKDAWFEGTSMVPVRIEEAVSDVNGNIFISGFWNWHLFSKNRPNITIYKFGYVCWDQKYIYTDRTQEYGDRKDFNSTHRVAKLKKWPDNFSFMDHQIFMHCSTQHDSSKAEKRLFDNTIAQENIYQDMEANQELLKSKLKNKEKNK